ncbi:MAG TPA: glycosyltransferase family 1 protein [Acidobacteriota bacterium]|nr:glycosyltransferase family 1 protein [Acidobacteriota bacterium]
MSGNLRIAIDMRPALRQGTGVGTFVEQLALALDSLEGDHSLALFSSSSRDRWPVDRLVGMQKSEVVDRRWPVRLLNLFWNRFGRPRIERFVGRVDIAHSPTPLLLPSKAAQVVTIHDLYFLRCPEQTRAEIRRDYAPLVRRHVKAADAVVAVSEATKSETVELLGVPAEKIVVCGEDAAPVFDQPPAEEELAWSRTIAPNPFFLFVGTIEPRKNLPLLLQAYGLLQKRYHKLQLVIAGERGWDFEAFDEGLSQLEVPARVVVTGYLDRRSLRALYHSATALVMPSHCEGFGLPLVEAMACACPLIVADNSSLPEVAGDAALYWRSGEASELSTLLEKMLTSDALRTELSQNGRRRRQLFSWRKTAEIVMGLYHDLAGVRG